MLSLKFQAWLGRAAAPRRRGRRPRRACRIEVEPQERRELLSAGVVDAAALRGKVGAPAVALRITPPTGVLVTDEGGQTATFTVELGNRKSRATLLLVSSDATEVGLLAGGGIVGQEVLKLTPRNRKATVTIAGVNDGIREGDQTYLIRILSQNSDRRRNRASWLDTGKSVTVLHRDPVPTTPIAILPPGETTPPVTPPAPPAQLPGYRITSGPTWEAAGTDSLGNRLYQIVMAGTVTGPVGATFYLGGEVSGSPNDPTGDTAYSGWQPSAWTGDKSPPILFTRSEGDPQTVSWTYRSGKLYANLFPSRFLIQLYGSDGEYYNNDWILVPATS